MEATPLFRRTQLNLNTALIDKLKINVRWKAFFYCGSVAVEIGSCEQKVGSRGKLTTVQEENLEIIVKL